MFCEKCGSIMTSKKGKSTCRCGHVSKGKPIQLKEKITCRPSEINVIHEETNTLPVVEEKCPKCGHNKANYWTMQTRAADEGETKFLKCEKCRYTWRDYG